MKQYFKTRVSTHFVDGALLLIRLVAGVAFVLHGWGKIQNPFSWMGPESSVPGVLQMLAAFSEVGGGLAMILGLLSRLGSLGVAFTMVGAVYSHAIVRGDPFVNPRGGSYELALVYLTIALLIVVNGPGKFSLDAKIFGRK